MMRFRVTAPPTDEPIDLKMVRDTHLRGIPDDSSENDYLRHARYAPPGNTAKTTRGYRWGRKRWKRCPTGWRKR